jgi:gliding motility-associated-like protein
MKKIASTFLYVLLGVPAMAQSFNRDPGNPNLDLSLGDFSYWNLGWGPRTDADSAAGPQPGASSHTITLIYGTNWDGNAGTGKLARVPSGLHTVARFGSPSGGGYGSPRAYSMSYPIKVDARYPILFLQLASVMDKTHYNDYNTHYRFRLSNSPGVTIPSQPCTGLELYPMGTGSTGSSNVATTPDIGLKVLPEVGTIAYQPWQSVAINLSAYAGQTVTLSLEHFDCWTGFHGSYEYLSAGMQPATDTFYYCASDTVTTISPYIPRFKSYQWNTGDTTPDLRIHNPADGTLYHCTVGSYNGCNTQFNYRLLAIRTIADFATEPGSICRELRFRDLSATSRGTIVRRRWQFGDPASGTADTSSLEGPVHTFPAEGVYTVTLDVITSEGCSQRIQQTINVQEAELQTGFIILPDTVCHGYLFRDTSKTSKGMIDQWSWTFGDPASGAGNTSLLKGAAHVFSTPGLYEISLQVQSSIGCAGRFQMQLNVPELQVPGIAAQNSCLGDPVLLTMEAPLSLRHSWDFGDSSGLSAADTGRHLYAAAGTYPVVLHFIDDHYCSGTTNSSAQVFPLPQAAIQAKPSRAPITAPEISFTGSPAGALLYSWQFGAEATQTSATPTVSHRFAAEIRDHIITLEVRDANGCMDTAKSLVTISAAGVFLPSAFSPNGDHQNDVFYLINVTDQQVEDFSIYNRYGQCVFQTKDATQGWDGMMNGSPMEIGSYYYHVSLRYTDGHKELLKGDISLVR